MLTMDKLISKEEEVGIKEITKNKMVEENQEDRIEVPAIEEFLEDNPKNTTDLSQDNLKDTTDLNRDNLKDTTDLNQGNLKDATDPIPTKENLGRNLTAVNHVLSQNKTAGIKANQKKK